MRRYLLPVLNWLILLSLTYAWLVLGVAGAGNLLKAFCWLVGVIGLLMLLIDPTRPSTPNPPRALAVWSTCCYAALVLSLIWSGHNGYAGLLCLFLFGHSVWRDQFNPDGTLKAKG